MMKPNSSFKTEYSSKDLSLHLFLYKRLALSLLDVNSSCFSFDKDKNALFSLMIPFKYSIISNYALNLEFLYASSSNF